MSSDNNKQNSGNVNQDRSKETIYAPEYGFFNDLHLDFLNLDFLNNKDKKIVVLTGENGAGKSNILSFIVKKYVADSKKTIFSTTSMQNINKYNRRDPYFREYRDREYITDVDSFLENVSSSAKINTNKLQNALFREGSVEYQNRKKIIDRIVELVKKIATEELANRFLNKFGIATEKQIEDKFENNCQDKFIIYSNTAYNRVQTRFNTDSVQRQYTEWKNGLTEETIASMKQEAKENAEKKLEKDKFKDYQQFTSMLAQNLFNDFNIDNLIEELADDILADYKSKYNSKRKKNSLFDDINKELKEQKEYFNYKLNKPDLSSNVYTLAFEYKNSNLNDKGIVSFNELSTGEKNIFTLLVYKYLTTKSDSNYEYLILDEFDANLNPKLIRFYVNILNEIAENGKMQIILTTHNLTTLRALYLDPPFKENTTTALYELKKEIIKEDNTNENKTKKSNKAKHYLNLIQDEERYNKYLYEYSDGCLITKNIYETDQINKAKVIIIVEGKGDKHYIGKYLETQGETTQNKYFIKAAEFGGGCDKIYKTLVTSLEKVPQDKITNSHGKSVVLLYDRDVSGFDSFREFKSGSIEGKCIDIEISKAGKNLKKYKKYIAITHIAPNVKDEEKHYCTENDIDNIVNNTKKPVEIEDLIVPYNIDLYNKYLEEKNTGLNIENFFNKRETHKGENNKEPCHKGNIEAFFNEKYKELNFDGFKNLFARIDDLIK